MVSNCCVNQPTIVEKVFNTVKEYELGFEPSAEPLIEVRIREGLYINVNWLSYPYIDYEGRVYKLAEFLEEAEESYKIDLVKDILENWYKQFCQLCGSKVKGGWADNYNALSVIWYAIQNGEEFNVYVPMFDINFTNEDGENDDEELWKPVDAFGVFIDQAMDCYDWIAEQNVENPYVMKMDGDRLVVTNETSADIDRELTEDERKQAIKKLEKVRADLKRKAEESVVYYDNDRVQQKLAAKMAADAVMRKADKHVLTATRKLKDCLKALKKYHLPQHSLNVDGWVVRLYLVSSYIDNGKANYEYMINLPWLDYELSISAFSDYVTAKKDKKCPVAWEYLYLINKTLQEL